MPYIKKWERAALEKRMQELVPVSPGELNFIFTYLAQQYLKDNGLNYQRINDVLGALEGCKLEFYRRIAVPYEDNKIKTNGDVMIIEEEDFKDRKETNVDSQ